ncbi:MAG: valine--tRNA ligase [Patescibacteria group bacterium]
MTKQMDKRYEHATKEKEIYSMWESSNLFNPENTDKIRKENSLPVKGESWSVLMPPPNANAPLHCGHATYSIQDLYTRFKRMQGYSALYVPGTDHAGFETQVVYERNLKKEGKSRFDFDRKTLYENVLNFVKENSDVAINQLKRLGMSADWSRNTFMLDEHVINTVYETFKKMHADGLVYKDYYMVNYSPYHGTTFSNLETEHKETVSPLYYVNYKIKDTEQAITVATVRPETIFADVAIAVNPEDSRYKNIVGKICINPLNGREIPLIADSYVDPEFGTGALKITPGHDFNDYEIGKKHDLEVISSIDLEGKMNENAPEVCGVFATKARTLTADLLKEKGALVKVDEKYVNNLLVDYKDGKPIEPMLLPNWFIKMDELAKKAAEKVKNDEVAFNLPTWKKQTLDWLENIRDWPISRQTVFGIQIPVWYCATENPNMRVVFIDSNGETKDGSISDLVSQGYKISEINSGIQKLITGKDSKYVLSVDSPGDDYIQETDTFDTWFSSGQWPLTTLHYPNGNDFKAFYPTSLMDSMWDIMFFWITRMIIFGVYLTGEVPYKMVYMHGRINDAQGRKMSKSLGNVINPIDWVDKYGADALRMGILVGGNTAAKMSALSEDKVRGYRNFSNKIWNMTRFMNLMFDEYEASGGTVPVYSSNLLVVAEDTAILERLNTVIKDTTDLLESYRIKEAGDLVYDFVWHEVADVYIEQVKNREDKSIALSVLRHVMSTSFALLHPFMPFVTESVWEYMRMEIPLPLIVSNWPTSA